ncbi:PEP-CTERM sorting domain-containing protein [Merismopedia glauca]|uniref:PEP-CTERM sorting domain-containing protein n=1 Tax=Merismopedia glauca CCAP 1448/3 TaxID=1296344 RepID=A0A2T1CAA4_9CYAN|nr:PEP-CTERM sorting domain-containing protein [Merismopedia glauca]PSB05206.1 PEP-CTERM sorting domain-containing protein [Merismopedia glauca CCAP 1448/3]
MKTLLTKVAVATTAGAALSLGVMGINPAQAASFNFSYTLQSGSILSGILEGDVQSDGDTVFVSSISNPSFNGVAGPDLPFVYSLVEFLGGPSGSPTVSFSGLNMNFLACSNSGSGCFNGEGFLFDGIGAINGSSVYNGSPAYGAVFEAYNPDKWQLTAQAVPEPTTMLGTLAFSVLGGSALLKRKRKKVS